MKIKHVLWLVGNGWIRTPDDCPNFRAERNDIFVFDNLRQFSDWAAREDKKLKRELQPTCDFCGGEHVEARCLSPKRNNSIGIRATQKELPQRTKEQHV